MNAWLRPSICCVTRPQRALLSRESSEGLRRLRVGRYRMVYEWQRRDLVILVVRVGHRREVVR